MVDANPSNPNFGLVTDVWVWNTHPMLELWLFTGRKGSYVIDYRMCGWQIVAE